LVSRAISVAFEGIEARPVEIQCSLVPGLPSFSLVGLPDKAVSEARERVRAALNAMAIALPSRKITINLSPADLPKEGSHFDLPIAMALLAAMGLVPPEEIEEMICLGELSLDGGIVAVTGALPAAMLAAAQDRTLLCPKECGNEAAWVGDAKVLAAANLNDVIQHFTGQRIMAPATAALTARDQGLRDMADVKGQEGAKRALEIAAAGRHHVLMTGPPGSGKSMLAARLPGILPPLSPTEALETSMIHSISGLLDKSGIVAYRPFREPHHTASMAAIVGGGKGARPGEVSLAHNGVLFLDELPEFSRAVLETLRQPIETSEVVVSRANAHIRYPCRFMLVAAANPCRCGYLADPSRACAKAPLCGDDYMGRISGPLMDRFDIQIEVAAVSFRDLEQPARGESSSVIAKRIAAARSIQSHRFTGQVTVRTNADADEAELEKIADMSQPAKELLVQAADRFRFSARGYHRTMRVARTIADLATCDVIGPDHVAEAIGYRHLGTPVLIR